MRVNMTSLCSLLVLACSAAVTENEPKIDYDAIIVGGGPSGLSALSGLARVRRNVLLVDSGVYRNGATRHMHDVIGNDGLQPAYYRWAARRQLAHYGTVSMTNGTVFKIQPEQNNTYFTVMGNYAGDKQLNFTARKIVLGTGLQDLLPDTPGLRENWGKGIYWCPWCDGHEHADQPLGLIGPLHTLSDSVREILTLNEDIIAFVNGTDTRTSHEATEKASPGWQAYMDLHNIRVENRTIESIERLRDGSDNSVDFSLPTQPEHDLFRIHFTEGEPMTRAAFFTSFKEEQSSTLGHDMGVQMYGNRLGVDFVKGLITSIPGVYAVGDCNSDNATNVPHALFSGKRAAIFLHLQLEHEAANAELTALNRTTKRSVHEEARLLWDRMNGEVGDLLYAGPFDNKLEVL